MGTRLLDGTLFERWYLVFTVESDQSLILKMCQIGLIYTVIVGAFSFLKPAPYGRHSVNNGSAWIYGPLINAKFAWMIQESPAWIVPLIIMYQSRSIHLNNTPNAILVALFMVHYIQRSFIYPLRMTHRANPVPVMVCLFALVFCLYNGFLQSHFLLNVHLVNQSSIFFIPGIVVFIVGMAINIHHDGILLSLRKGKKESDTKSEFKIPRGFLFEYVSGANYAGEILEWWGFAIASGGFPQVLFAIFSTLFLGARAWHHHNFYHRNFGKSYPASRKALIPFIF